MYLREEWYGIFKALTLTCNYIFRVWGITYPLVRCSHIVLHVHIIDIAASLSDNLSRSLCRNFGNLDLSLPILDAVFELAASVLLLDEFERIRHVTHFFHKTHLLSVVHVYSIDDLPCLSDILHGLVLFLYLDLHFRLDALLLLQCII